MRLTGGGAGARRRRRAPCEVAARVVCASFHCAGPARSFPGDTITYATEIVELRPSASRPEWGIMTSRNTGTNQRGEPVLSFISSAFVERHADRS
jgi:hypothetical protein